MPTIGFTLAGMLGFLGMLALLRLVKWSNQLQLTFKSRSVTELTFFCSGFTFFPPQFFRDHWRVRGITCNGAQAFTCPAWCASWRCSCQSCCSWCSFGWYLGAWQAPWMDASGTSNASVANATVEEESSPGTLAKLKRKEFEQFNL